MTDKDRQIIRAGYIAYYNDAENKNNPQDFRNFAAAAALGIIDVYAHLCGLTNDDINEIISKHSMAGQQTLKLIETMEDKP